MSYTLFNDALTMRFNTLIGNIKAKSNSFYDAYLDLLEATIKYFLEEKSIEYYNTEVFYFKNATATFSSFPEPAKIIKF